MLPAGPGNARTWPGLVFLDSHIRELYADWPGKARAVVGGLRLTAGQHPEDAALHALVGELSAKSGEFASMWADHRIKACTVADYEMRHPLVGTLTVTQQTLSNTPGPVVVVGTTEPDSPSRAALMLLAQLTAPHQGLGRTGADTAPRRRGLTHLTHGGPADNGPPRTLGISARTHLTHRMRHRLVAACPEPTACVAARLPHARTGDTPHAGHTRDQLRRRHGHPGRGACTGRSCRPSSSSPTMPVAGSAGEAWMARARPPRRRGHHRPLPPCRPGRCAAAAGRS